jgi:hypothetical protein
MFQVRVLTAFQGIKTSLIEERKSCEKDANSWFMYGAVML